MLYDSSTNRFQLVSLDGYKTVEDDDKSEPALDSLEYDFVCPNCGYRHEKEKSPISAPSTASDDYIRTSAGDLLRGDYFKLLAQNNTDTQATNELVQSVIQSTPALRFLGDAKVREKIPFELINQGYFAKFFHVLKVLGNGANGKVYKVEHELMGLNLGVFALKKIAIGDDVQNLVKTLNEVKFLYDLSANSDETAGANNVIRYNHVWIEVDTVSQFGPKVPVIFILYEYCDGGDLESFVESVSHPTLDIAREKMYRKMRKTQPEEAAKYRQKYARSLNDYEIYKIFQDIVDGLRYLHKLKIIHRDLKPSNCLFKTRFADNYEPPISLSELYRIPPLLVSDFGESIMENTPRNSTGSTGTLEYCAPELFEADGDHLKQFSHASDIYSLGMILYFLCFDKLPFNSDSPDEIRDEIRHRDLFDHIDTIRSDILPDWVELIRQLVNRDSTERPTIAEVSGALEEIRDKLAAGSIVSSLPDVSQYYTLVGVAVLTLANIWCLNNGILTNLAYLLLGLSISSPMRIYTLAIELILLLSAFIY